MIHSPIYDKEYMARKYSIINQKRYLPDGRCLHRIVAKRDFGTIEKGTLGGYIEDTSNLSQRGDCWVGDKAAVYGNARVRKNALVRGHAVLSGYAIATDNAIIEGRSLLDQHAFVCGHAYVGNSTYLSGSVNVCDHVRLYCYGYRSNSGKTYMPNACGLVRIKDYAFLEGRVSIRDHAVLAGHCKIIGRVRVTEHAFIADEAEICGRVLVSGTAHVIQKACVCDRTIITGNSLICDQTVLGGKSLVTCNVIARVTGRIDNVTFSGDQYATSRDGYLHISTVRRRENATA